MNLDVEIDENGEVLLGGEKLGPRTEAPKYPAPREVQAQRDRIDRDRKKRRKEKREALIEAINNGDGKAVANLLLPKEKDSE